MIAKPASALLYDTVCCVVPGMGVRVCASWWDEQSNGLKKHVHTFFD